LTKFNPGILALTAVNTYSGPTTITAGRLQLGVANAIASSSSLIMNGGTMDPGGFNQAMASTTLGLTASSTIDFGAGASELDFANSAALTWTGVLNLANWNGSIDALRIGVDGTGLTSAQLADIEFNGAGLGSARINALGFIVIPEPSTAVLGLLGMLGVWASRRRTV
jgi:autotransporter-associated beta strand protein